MQRERKGRVRKRESFKFISPLKTLELWLSREGLCPNALVIILLLTVFRETSAIYMKERKETEIRVTADQKT